MMWLIKVLLICSILGLGAAGKQDEVYTFCAYWDENPDVLNTNGVDDSIDDSGEAMATLEEGLALKEADNFGEVAGIKIPNQDIVRCESGTHYCYTLWHLDPKNDTLIAVLKQGCWTYNAMEPCTKDTCISKTAANRYGIDKTKFCCCVGHMCNRNYSDGYVPDASTSQPVITNTGRSRHSYRERTIIIALSTVVGVAIFIAVAYLVCRLFMMYRKRQPDGLNLMEAPSSGAAPNFDLDELKLTELLDRGRYGQVWKGTLYDHDVAIKVFGAHNRHYFHNERDVYSLPHMEHDSLLHYIGADECKTADGGSIEYRLVLSYIATGNLHNHLKNNVLNWSEFVRIALSVSSGLAHLHQDILKEDVHKPPIAHRDINTRNILVQPDGTCVICDLGFAIRTSGSKLIHSGWTDNAEQVSLVDVGTVRYMAPEILEGAVNLRDCESSLKQIDVYALGLVLWETGMRCSDLFQGLELPEYQLPFQEEVGPHPSFEDMQDVVCRNKWRPRFPDVWKDTNQAIRSLKETIEDCWDQDAEARLTALCVQERMLDLPILWERQKMKGISPSVNPQQLRNPSSSTGPDSPDYSEPTDRNGNNVDQRETDEPHETHALLPSGSGRYQRYHNDASISESTAETIVMSPSESEPPPRPTKGNVNQFMVQQKQAKVEPHQGRNPCLERNINTEEERPLAVRGNTLIDKDKVGKAPSNTGGDTMFDSLTDNLQTALVQNESLPIQERSNQQVAPQNDALPPRERPNYTAAPIPYVQNAVRDGGIAKCPKQENVPGNGTHRNLAMPAGAAGPAAGPHRVAGASPSSSAKRDDKKKDKKSKGGLMSLFDRKLFSHGSNLAKPAPPPAAAGGHHQRASSDSSSGGQRLQGEGGHQRSGSDSGNAAPVNTEVRLVNGNAHTVVNNIFPGDSAVGGGVGGRVVGRAELGVASKRELAAAPEQLALVCSSRADTDERAPRPSMLPIEGATGETSGEPAEPSFPGDGGQALAVRPESSLSDDEMIDLARTRNGDVATRNDLAPTWNGDIATRNDLAPTRNGDVATRNDLAPMWNGDVSPAWNDRGSKRDDLAPNSWNGCLPSRSGATTAARAEPPTTIHEQQPPPPALNNVAGSAGRHPKPVNGLIMNGPQPPPLTSITHGAVGKVPNGVAPTGATQQLPNNLTAGRAKGVANGNLVQSSPEIPYSVSVL
ncbi:PREDICTED: serine/threonine-protein kinase par-1-like [Priapulus caudatus]|uniref:Serine/threonine-protein kinase receptor n=1 Tax=Priapulus caudatus TaxID=37621 RepID=A0ABM1DSH6_PRICU|nr:PREDICTED: serine/threonine-protein kinase par-1-like [Priapulus caudatus]